MLKRRVAAIAWRVGTGVSAETRLNEQAAHRIRVGDPGGTVQSGALEMAGRRRRGRHFPYFKAPMLSGYIALDLFFHRIHYHRKKVETRNGLD
jgi:hypothetical protein